MKQPSKDEKIEALERILRAIFGRPDGRIEYSGFPGYPQIRVECDIDDAVKVIGNLEAQEIEASFMDTLKKEKDWTEPVFNDAGYVQYWKAGKTRNRIESVVFVDLYLNPRYWRQVEQLEAEVKRLRKELKKGSRNEKSKKNPDYPR